MTKKGFKRERAIRNPTKRNRSVGRSVGRSINQLVWHGVWVINQSINHTGIQKDMAADWILRVHHSSTPSTPVSM